MRTLRVHPLMHIETHLLVLAFLLGFQLAILARASRMLAHADAAVAGTVDSAQQAIDAAVELAERRPERVYVAGAGGDEREETVNRDAAIE